MENGQKVDWGSVAVMLDSSEDDSRFGMQFAGEGETSSPSEAGWLIRYENCSARQLSRDGLIPDWPRCAIAL